MREMCLEVEERALVTTWASHLYVQPPLLYFPRSATGHEVSQGAAAVA